MTNPVLARITDTDHRHFWEWYWSRRKLRNSGPGTYGF